MPVKNVFKPRTNSLLFPTAFLFSLALVGLVAGQGPGPGPKPGSGPNAPGAPAAGGPVAPGPPKSAPVSKLFPTGLPRLDQFLKTGLERHPDVVVAKSKLDAARAELLKAEAAALKELIKLHQGFEATRRSVETPAQRTPTETETLASELSLLEWEAALALGFQSQGTPGGANTNLAAGAETVAENPAPPLFINLAYPQTDVANLIKKNPKLEIDLVDASLQDFANAIKEKTEISIIINKDALEGIGFQVNSTKINLTTNSESLSSILQQLEDHYRQFELHFVVRDYGILVTTKGEAPEDAVSALDFIKLKTEDEVYSTIRDRREAEARENKGLGGGFF